MYHIFWIKKSFFLLFFAGLLLSNCSSDSFYDEENNYVTVELSSQNESANPITFFKERYTAVAVELKESLLDDMKTLWKEINGTFPITKIVLGTFDSKGLKNKIVFSEASQFFREVQDLKASPYDEKNSSPTMHVLNELLQYLPNNGSLLLITTTNPSDEDFGEYLEESLLTKKCQLSVLWAGNKQSYSIDRLKILVTKTGGRFSFLSNESRIENISGESNTLENAFRRLRFPDNENEIQVDDAPLVSRAADQKVWQKISVPLIVEVASGANLEIRPGAPTQIPFTVKNNLNIPLRILFNAKFNGVIQNVQPQQAMLQPGVSATVTVHLQPLSSAQNNAVGTVTLFAVGANKVTPRSALIFMTPQNSNDKTEPKIYYKYENDCSNYKEPSNCENGHWGLEATIQDEDSGLLKILSEPYGLLFQSEFVAGTKSPVKVYYGATCCQPTVQIWAEDLKGNYFKKSFDVFNQTLLAGEIATIVLGVILLLFIVIGIVVAVVLVRRRNRRNMIIPRPRSGSR